jgi:hypothetical protein
MRSVVKKKGPRLFACVCSQRTTGRSNQQKRELIGYKKTRAGGEENGCLCRSLCRCPFVACLCRLCCFVCFVVVVSISVLLLVSLVATVVGA